MLGTDSEYSFVKIEGSAKTKKDGSEISADPHMTITPNQKAMSGTIYEPNVLYAVKYTNKAPQKQIKILKTDQNSTTPLKDAVSSLYGADSIGADGKVKEDAVALIPNQKQVMTVSLT